MSHSSNIFSRVPVEMPNKSGFNMDHENLFTARCGTLTPCLCQPLLPNDTISLGVNAQVQLPPMVTDFYGKVDAVFEAFFVPYRLLWGGWEDFITHPTKNPVYPVGTLAAAKPTRVPTMKLPTNALGRGSLADYLGYKSDGSLASSLISCMPFLAYHKIYDEWYRDSRIQAPAFYRPKAAINNLNAFSLPYVSVISDAVLTGPSFDVTTSAGATQVVLGDGVPLFGLRQRNWSKGYFTTASPYPQAGQAAEVQFDVANDQGAFTIASLRAANSLQKWMERNNFSYKYGDQIHAQFGIYPDAAKMDKPIYLGRSKQVVYNRSVFQTSPSGDSINDLAGSKKGSSQTFVEGSLIDKFTASEHGFVFVMFSLVPHSYYSTGCARYLFELESEDFPFPLLSGMGDQPIFNYELSGIGTDSGVFGYTDLYAHYKYVEDSVHGKLVDGESLDSYCLQRSFGEGVSLGSEFLQIPTSALDQVQQLDTDTMGFSCWVDCFFPFKKVSTLPAYSLPTLADLKHTHTEHLSRGGSSL